MTGSVQERELHITNLCFSNTAHRQVLSLSLSNIVYPFISQSRSLELIKSCSIMGKTIPTTNLVIKE